MVDRLANAPTGTDAMQRPGVGESEVEKATAASQALPPPSGADVGAASPAAEQRAPAHPVAAMKAAAKPAPKSTPRPGGAARVSKPSAPSGPKPSPIKATAAPGASAGAAVSGAIVGEAEQAASEQARLATATMKTGARAKAMAATPPAASAVKAVAGSAAGPANEGLAGGKAAQIGDMANAPAGAFDRAGFIAAIEAKVNAQAPKTLEQADGFEQSGALESVKQGVKESAGGTTQVASGAVEQATEAPPDPSRGTTKQGGELPISPTPPAPASVGAAAAMPLPKPPASTDLSAPKRETDAEMASAGVTEEQLATSNEPTFTSALDAKKQGEAHSASAPDPVRAAEKQTIRAAAAGAKNDEVSALGAMFTARKSANAAVDSEKTSKKGQNEGARAQVVARLESIYSKTQSATKAILDGIDAKVDSAFDSGESQARKAFENKYKHELDRFKDDRYSGVLGSGRWLKDKLFSPPAEVGRIIEASRQLYLAEMRKVVGRIADIVGAELTKAKDLVAAGRREINDYVAALPKDLQKQGAELAKGVQGKFDALDQEVDSKKDEVVDKIVDRYKSAKAEVDERVDAMKAENMGLWDRAKAAVVGVIQTIIELKNALVSALRKAAGAITMIIRDPIGFLNNLIAAFTQGLQMFFGNIKTHLVNGVVKWLTGAMGDMQITLPEKFDLKGIVDLVLQVLGITWHNIRAQIVKRLGPAGEAVIGRIEQGVGIIAQLLTSGPIALWTLIVEKVSGLWDMVIGKIQEFVEGTIIAQGIQWLMSLINPAAAFIKACKMIIDGVMWLWNNASRIMQLIDTIASSAVAIAKGSIGAAASAIEQVLGRLTPMLISFLADLLNIGGIAQKVKEIIGAVRKPINNVIGAVVDGAVKFGRKLLGSPLGKKLAGGFKQAKAFGKNQIDKAKRLGDKAVQKVKKKLYGGDDSPEGKQQRETAGATAAVNHVNKWAGKKIGAAVAIPGLMAIKLKNGLGRLDLIKMGQFWGVEASVDRSTSKPSGALAQGSDTIEADAGTPGHARENGAKGGRLLVGLIGSYNDIGGAKAQDPRRGTFKFLLLEAEHLIRREFLDELMRTAGLPGIPRGGQSYRDQTTVKIYEAAADEKTRGWESGSNKASVIRQAAAAKAQATGRDDMLRRLRDILKDWAYATKIETAHMVVRENAALGADRGTVGDPQPTASLIDQAYTRQLGQALTLLDAQAEMAGGERDLGESAWAQQLLAGTGHLGAPSVRRGFVGSERVATISYESPRMQVHFTARGGGNVTWELTQRGRPTASGIANPGTIATIVAEIEARRAEAKGS